VNCTRSGSFNYSGFILLAGNDGNVRKFPFSSDYIVGEPSATISNEDLNVVYRGIDHKFSISVPGVAAENISVRVSGATVQKTSGGKFIIRPTQDGEINIAVYAKVEGKEILMGNNSYRVRYLPDPKAYLQYSDAGGITRLIQDGSLNKRMLRGDNVAIVASYGEDELIQAKFNVISFAMLTVFGSVETSGSRLSNRQLSDIERLEGGDYITFKNIKAVGPDGKVRNLGLIQVQI
jgi:gliding motility-associated protein GldM